MVTAALRQPAAIETNRSALLYQALNFVVVRAPLLPLESFFELANEQSRWSFSAEPQVRRALAIASTSLVGAIERFQESGLTQRDAERMRAKLLRYQIRMATRPTPFGLFAGVALARWGPRTNLALLSTCALTRARPDMAWLMNLVFSAEANPEIRKRLRFFVNPLAVVGKDRVCLSEPAPSGKKSPNSPVSVRATAVVKVALALARSPICYEDLVDRLCDSTPSATSEKVEALLTELWQQTFLLTDLRPPLTTDSPARYVAERLASIPAASEFSSRLECFSAALQSWERLDPEDAVKGLPSLISSAGTGSDDSREAAPIQVDMGMSVDGQLAEAVAVEAARAAELLLRLTPSPRGLSSLAAYRQAFINRYGHERQVPLLELLDAQRGLGPPSKYGHAPVGPDAAKSSERAQTLLQLACAALNRHERVVVLDEKMVERLETWHPDSRTAPVSLDINLLIAARSADAIDDGAFTLIVGPNLGALAAGRNLGRFADLLGSDGPAALHETAAAEEKHTEDFLCAELVWLPPNFHSANVVIRPSIRSHELVFGTSSGVPDWRVIPLDELVVEVENARFVVRWPTARKRIIFRAGHMLNHYAAPAVARFLLDLSYDGSAIFSSFDWGPAESFPYPPRVQTGRIVLRPAQWRIRKDDWAAGSGGDMNAWRAEWNVPRYVCLSTGDNRLILDLDDAAQAAELKSEVKKLPDGGALIVQEVLPAFEDTWLRGPRGAYCSEFIASLVLRHDKTAAKTTTTHQDVASRTDAIRVQMEEVAAPTPRVHPPGSEWLFLKLYCPSECEDDILAEHLLPFVDQAIASGLADSWFFIRYSDPDPHLRLRFHGQPEQLNSILFGHVCDWAGSLLSDGLAARFVFDTYEQEVERFGGADGMSAAETLFSIDSRSSAELLHASKAKDWTHDQITLLALSIDDLLAGLGFDEAGRLGWYRTQTTTGGPDVGSEYRQRKNVLRSLLGDPAHLAAQPGGAHIASILAARRNALSLIARRFRDLTEEGAISQPLERLCASFIHLHVNRLAGLASASEPRILSLLLRARESLEKAPAAK